MDINGKFRKEIRLALLDAFPQLSSLRILVDEVLDAPLQNISLADNLQGVVFDLISWAVAQGRLAELVLGAASENPGNNRLKDIAIRFQFADANLGENERIVLQAVPFQNAGQWLDRLSKIRHTVCRVEPQSEKITIEGFASGFLIAPDVIMTNFHVVEPLMQMARRGAVRFDYEVSVNGEVSPGRTCNFAENWLLASSPVDQLDFALVRLSEVVGDDAVPSGTRCFLKPVGHNFTTDEPLIVLQHPQAKPLKLAFGTVMTPVDGERVTYSVNTEGGSSGSPCLTTALDVVALHHWGGTKHNRGVRMSQILAHLDKLQLSNLLG